uniref:Uncharacterized protein n=1 Tax=Myoviridae sp. ctcyQ27 TaxID=2825139 RepID=A0A8S5UFK4_9CAUD|nr:MAG TPA: hypothetical protein [Myoviridae sp. ctcyQ27]
MNSGVDEHLLRKIVTMVLGSLMQLCLAWGC